MVLPLLRWSVWRDANSRSSWFHGVSVCLSPNTEQSDDTTGYAQVRSSGEWRLLFSQTWADSRWRHAHVGNKNPVRTDQSVVLQVLSTSLIKFKFWLGRLDFIYKDQCTSETCFKNLLAICKTVIKTWKAQKHITHNHINIHTYECIMSFMYQDI